jgi:hypothetical protein
MFKNQRFGQHTKPRQFYKEGKIGDVVNFEPDAVDNEGFKMLGTLTASPLAAIVQMN